MTGLFGKFVKREMKNLRKIFGLLALLLCLFWPSVHGQGELLDDAQIFYRNERTFAAYLYSNGWGLDLNYAKRKDAFNSFTYGIGFGVISHPKEYKSQSPYTGGWGRSYVFGKMNEAASIRMSVGQQKEIFSKFDKGGIAIRYFYSGGLSLALLKPIYYLKIVRIDYETGRIVYDRSQFDPDYMQSIYDIYDRESFFVGLGETKIRPGAFIRTGISFEYSTSERAINALEAGLQLEGFITNLAIMAGSNDQQFLLSFFVGYRFGKVTD